MASRFVVAVALFAVCHSSPVLINGIDRDGRSYTFGDAGSSGFGNQKASASVINHDAQAYGSSDNANDGLGNSYAGNAFARVGQYDSNVDVPRPQAYNNVAYYPVPAPAAVVTYQQNFDSPAEVPAQIAYVPQGATVSQSSVNANGGSGSASSIANEFNAATNARTQGTAAATSSAQNNGVVGNVAPAIIAAKTQGFNTVYNPNYGTAYSNANANGALSSAAATAKTAQVPTRKSISWRFGTAYDAPAAYGTVKSGVAAQGASSGHSFAASNGAGYDTAVSAANSNGGSASSNAGVNNHGYALLKSGNYGPGYETAATSANANGRGSAAANANLNNAGYSATNVVASSQDYGSANSNAKIHNGAAYGTLRSTGWGGRTNTNAQASGFGNAISSARHQELGYNVVNSAANSFGSGAASADAQSI